MKKFSLQNLELAQAALEDAKSFNLSASIEQKDGEISIAYESPAMCENKESKAVSMEDIYAVMKSYSSEYEYQLKWMREDMNYTRDIFYKHMEGHIPSIKDAGKLQAAINILGLGDSFEVKKAQIYVQY